MAEEKQKLDIGKFDNMSSQEFEKHFNRSGDSVHLTPPSRKWYDNVSIQIAGTFAVLGTLLGTLCYAHHQYKQNKKEETAHPFYQQNATLVRTENRQTGCFDLDGNPETIEVRADYSLRRDNRINYLDEETICETVFKDNINRTRKIGEWKAIGFDIRRSENQHTR